GDPTDRIAPSLSSDGLNFTESSNWGDPCFVSTSALPYNTRYYLRVRAVTSTSPRSYSDYSNVISVVTLRPPTVASVNAKSTTSVNIIWDYIGPPYEGSSYKVERSTDPTFVTGLKQYVVNPPFTLIPNPNNPSKQMVSFTDNDSFTNQTYYYRVRTF